MKRALSVATMTALTLLALLFVGYAQEAATAVPSLLEQELAAMEAAFGSVQTVMGELITEVKGNMSGLSDVSARVKDLKDIVSAISLELKAAEGKLVGLRTDVDALGARAQEQSARIVALEAGLSELAAFCDELKARLDAHDTDISTLRAAAEDLAAAFNAHVEEFAAFKAQLLSDVDALRTGLYGDFESLKSDLYGVVDGLKTDVYGNLDGLRNMLYGDLQTLEQTFSSDITMLESQYAELAMRVQALEDEDVGTFKKKVLELERSMAALAIKVDNNRAKLEGFDQAIASLSAEMATTKEGIMKANEQLLAEYDARIQALEENDVKMAGDISTLYFISIVALLAGVGALIWGFLGAE
ncbi:MAG: hypothetical protein PHV11_06685 [Candidatus Bipolaricaulis sp.]|nr:hypothetical protein [Candidatus Bipolaricaulis sp.]MDD5220233.1 hypothetical protein [Candidatus Bipolaricaulis sp.]MDD5646820.1 hypothetical protein [Candidatus Bipolaricaulis sp.]